MEAEDLLEPSLFEQFMGEVCDPLHLSLGGSQWVIEVPDSDAVCLLDDLTRPNDILSELVGEDQADDILDALEPMPWRATLQVTAAVRDHFALAALPRGLWNELVEQIDLYGEAIEADLADRGSDILDWFRGRRPWQQLARLLTGLPEGSRYWAAVLDDDDLARQRLDADFERKPGNGRPPLRGETQDRMLLRAAVSALRRVEHAVYAAQAGKKAGRPPRALEGPETAEDRVRDQLANADVEDIFDQVAPGWRGDGDSPKEPPPSGYAASPSGLLIPQR